MIFYLLEIEKDSATFYSNNDLKIVPDCGRNFFFKRIEAESEQEALDIAFGTKNWKDKIKYSEKFNTLKYDETYRNELFKQATKDSLVEYDDRYIYLLMLEPTIGVKVDVEKEKETILRQLDSIIKMLREKVKDYIDRVIDLKAFT